RHERVVLLIDCQQRITAPAAAPNAALSIHSRVVRRVVGAATLPFDVCDLQHGAEATAYHVCAPQDSRTTRRQSSSTSRVSISGLATRSSMADIAASPISRQGW